METAPIILFVYNRPWHTEQTVEALRRNELAERCDLHIFADGPRDATAQEDVARVRNYIRTIGGFRKVSITERTENWGLARSVIAGVTEVIERHGRVIVLEDDLVTSPYFLTFMNEALEFYEDDPQICSVTGYSLPIRIPADYPWRVYLTHRHSSWGWGTYARFWCKIDWEIQDYGEFRRDRRAMRAFNAAGRDMCDMLGQQMRGKLDSWSIRFDYNCFRHGGLSLAPVQNLVKNVGFDNSGVHCGPESARLGRDLDPVTGGISLARGLELDPMIEAETRRQFRYTMKTWVKQFLKKYQ